MNDLEKVPPKQTQYLGLYESDDDDHQDINASNITAYSDNAIVIDMGSSSLKIKNIKSNEWRVVPAYLAKNSRNKFGQQAIDVSKRRKNNHPIAVLENGLVNDWNNMEKFLKLVFKNSLRGKAVMICETVPTFDKLDEAREQRTELAKLLVEKFYVEAYYVAPQPTLSILSFSQAPSPTLQDANGVVIDVGSGTSTVTVVYRGETISQCTQRSTIGGHLFDQLIMKRISERSGAQIKTNIFDACEIKERICFVSNKISEELSLARKQDEAFLKSIRSKEKFKGQQVELDLERFCVPELLFDVSSLNCGYQPDQTLPQLVIRARKKYEKFRNEQIRRGNADYDTESAKNLFRRYFIVGGCTKMRGMIERIQREVRRAIAEYELLVNNIEITKENIQEMINNYHLRFQFETNEDKRGTEAVMGATRVVIDSEDRDWVRAFEITQREHDVLMRCPR